ncbi:MAG: gluconate 2-dehydrogenase subunit 3 family protein [Reichenbachiella sp.]
MKRREALSSVGLIIGGTIIGSHSFLTRCINTQESVKGLPLSSDQSRLLNEIGETILPKTDTTPGAKEVNVGSFMETIVTDFYTHEEQLIFLKGLVEIDVISVENFGKKYLELDANDKTSILMILENQAGKYVENNESHFYIMMKQLTIWGYLSSEEVAFEGFNHMVLTPHFDGCVSLKDDDKAMFEEASASEAYYYATHNMKKMS